jgi:hypothetical protein
MAMTRLKVTKNTYESGRSGIATMPWKPHVPRCGVNGVSGEKISCTSSRVYECHNSSVRTPRTLDAVAQVVHPLEGSEALVRGER